MNKSPWLICVLAVATIALGAGVLWRLKATQTLGKPGLKVGRIAEVDSETVLLPANVLDMTSKVITNYEAEQQILPKDTTYAKRLYRAPDGFETFATVVLMGSDRTSIHRPEFCLVGQGWSIDAKETIQVPISRPYPYDLPVRKFTASRQVQLRDGSKVTARGLYLFWFVADNDVTSSHWSRMWSMGRELLSNGTLQRWAYVSYFTVCPPEQEKAALERMKLAIAASVPEFQLTTGRAGASTASSFVPAKSNGTLRTENTVATGR